MKLQIGKRSAFALMLACTIAATDAAAGQRFISQDSEGFCISLPYLQKQTLTRHIREGRLQLNDQKTLLEERVKNQRFNSLDVVITVVMPGGLLYAAIKRGIQLEKRKQLDLVTQDFNQLSGDLLTFESSASDLRVAALQ